MHVAIDFDQSIYACGFATEGEDISHTLGNIKSALNRIIKNTGATSHTIYISGDTNFRDRIAVTQMYKGNRSSRKPAAYKEIRDYLIKHWGAIQTHGYEADDAVSIELWEDYKACKGVPSEAEVCISSPDKDLNNTPGWHYNPVKKTMTWLDENQALRHFCYQLLMGDSVDNIPGLPHCTKGIKAKFNLTKHSLEGCGAKTAKKIMSESKTWEDAFYDVVQCYISWGHISGVSLADIKVYFEEQATLLWMCRKRSAGQPKPVQFSFTGMFGDIYDRAEYEYFEGSTARGSEESEGGSTESRGIAGL